MITFRIYVSILFIGQVQAQDFKYILAMSSSWLRFRFECFYARGEAFHNYCTNLENLHVFNASTLRMQFLPSIVVIFSAGALRVWNLRFSRRCCCRTRGAVRSRFLDVAQAR